MGEKFFSYLYQYEILGDLDSELLLYIETLNIL